MKSVWNENHWERKCPACGYEYHDYLDEDMNRQHNGDNEGFLGLTDTVLHEDDTCGHRYKRYQLCACPKCGTLQIDLSAGR